MALSLHPSRAPLLLASFGFASLGFGWVFIVVCFHYPEIAKLLFFMGSAAFLFSLSFGLFALFVVNTLYDYGLGAGLLQHLPERFSQQLQRPPFELLRDAHEFILLPIFAWVRVVVLVAAELDDADRATILGELDEEFRKDVFRRPAVRMLPSFVQRFLLGKNWKPRQKKAAANQSKPVEDSGLQTPQERTHSSPPSSVGPPPDGLLDEMIQAARQRQVSDAVSDATDENVMSHARSVDELLQMLRCAEGAARKSKQSSILQRILTEKITDNATMAMRHTAAPALHGVQRQIDRFQEALEKPPERIILRLPWRVTKFYVDSCSAVVNWAFDSAGPESGSSPAPTMAAAAPAVAAPEDDSTISGPGSTAPTQTHSRSVSDEEAVYRSGTLKED
eukprot:TRINITY_DN32591_c0_g1_i1.p1 TRINITY_DN32591_c0_g1~~TRINITY_DN32591_c0_g1_i1.p1  ORF type:complete len:392 (-),score=65.36 TRINITY_DN32591_c0_g1_i1:121-1296(-)